MEAGRQTDRKIYRYKLTDKCRDGETEKQTNKLMNRQTDGETKRQTDETI